MTSGRPNLPSGRPVRGSGEPGSETQDPDFDLKEAKICGPETEFPYGRANFDLLWGSKPRRFGLKGQFLGSQPGKGSRVLAPNGDRFSIFGPRRIRKS